MTPRDDKGRFLRSLPDGDTFVTISNEQIFKRIESMDDRLAVIEQHFCWTRRMVTSMVTVVTAGSALVSAVWYWRH